MSTDVLYPLLIGGGCLVAMYLVHLLTRPKPTRADITFPSGSPEEVESAPSSVDADSATASALVIWHRTHEKTLLDYFEYHDDLLTSPQHSDEDDPSALSAAFEDAYASHPAPDMRAELAATRAAADAMALAKERSDENAMARHRDIYLGYRAAWLERLWQFANDQERVARVRQAELFT